MVENPGIDPGTSHMLSERSTIWANSPIVSTSVTSLWTDLPSNDYEMLITVFELLLYKPLII